MNDGIIVVQIEPDRTLKILTLSASPEEAIRQIAQIMEYPSDDPLSTGNLAALYSRDLSPGGHFRTHKLKLYNVYHPGQINALTPQDATLIWHNSTTREEMPVNFMASNVQRREKGSSIRG